MTVGSKVVRADRYRWCVCERTYACWCKVKGQVFEVVGTKKFPCQSGTMVIVTVNGKKSDWLDSEYFTEVLL